MSHISKLDEFDAEIKKQLKVQVDLEREQAQYLHDLKKDFDDVIEWFYDKGYKFKHPMLLKESAHGPVLHVEDEYIYYWSRYKGVIRSSINGNQEEQSDIFEVIRLGGFINAVQGLSYLEHGLKEYTVEIHDHNRHLKSQLHSIKDY